MNILHIVNSLEVGGLEKFVVDLTQQLTTVNHVVACLSDRGGFFNNINGECLYLDVPPGLSFFTVLKLKKIILEKSIDIIHTHNQGPQFYGSLAGKITCTPIVHTKHGQNLSNSRRRFYLEKFSSYLTNTIITVSVDAEEICLDHLKIPKDKVQTILNGVDGDAFYKFPDKLKHQEESPFVIGTVGRLAPEKNHQCLLDACSRLLKDNYNILVKIVGDGPLREQLASECKKQGLADVVEFLGVQKDILGAMNGFDLFVLPSLTEGISLTLLESMACELPVVATNVGGNPEVVVEGITGLLVPSADSKALANAISFFVDSPEKCKEMGINSRKRALESFNMSKVARQYLDVYRRALK